MSDWEFIFDGVFGYLSSPLWMVPVMSFIEVQSVVFEPMEENYLSWTEIHNKYKSLIESLLSSYLKDVGITEQQFMEACGSSSAQNSSEMQPMFEQLWATEDFEIFKRMMVQKNVELQLQALQLIQKRQGLKKETKVETKAIVHSEEEILQEVMRKSELEYQESQNTNAVQESAIDPSLEILISQSKEVADRLGYDVLQKQEETKQTVQEFIKQEDLSKSSLQVYLKETPSPKPTSPPPHTPKTKTASPSPEKSNASSSPPTKEVTVDKPLPKPVPEKKIEKPTAKPPQPSSSRITKKPTSSSDAAASWIENAKQENATSKTTASASMAMSEDDLQKRELYLKQQRDRLLAMKKQEREKQLSAYAKTQPKRPASARVAKEAVTGEINQGPSEEEQKKIAIRKALAERLKKEVVYK